MGNVRINDARTGFELDGKPFFYLADTAWSAFTNVTLEDWEFYLTRREQQGFTHFQVNTTPQWDRQLPDLGIYPYESEDGVKMDFSRPRPEFWDHARTMCEMARNHGIRPALILVWANLVPGTWIEKIGKAVQSIPFEAIDRHVATVVEKLGEYDPIYIVSGDTDFDGNPETVRYYAEALRSIQEHAPEALKTFHLAGLEKGLPEELVDGADFFMFQSGHVAREDQSHIFELPQAFAEKYAKRPIVNSEPCYEQMGQRRKYGRYGRREVRFAAWTSILSGACAGITYGAQGIWNWRSTSSKGAYPGNIFGEPFLWQDALQFPGAWDYGFIGRFLGRVDMRELVPAQEELDLGTEEARLAKTEDGRYLAFLPWSNEVRIKADLTGFSARALDLESHFVADLPLAVEDGVTVIGQHPFGGDALVIVERA